MGAAGVGGGRGLGRGVVGDGSGDVGRGVFGDGSGGRGRVGHGGGGDGGSGRAVNHRAAAVTRDQRAGCPAVPRHAPWCSKQP